MKVPLTNRGSIALIMVSLHPTASGSNGVVVTAGVEQDSIKH
jgi:hypothetical protein